MTPFAPQPAALAALFSLLLAAGTLEVPAHAARPASAPTSTAVSLPTSTPATGPTLSATVSVPASTAGRQTSSLLTGTTGTVLSRPAVSAVSSGTVTTPVRSAPTGSTPVSALTLTLSAYAEELARIIKFDRQVLLMIKQISQERIGRLIGYDAYGYQIIAAGVAVPVPEDRTDRVLAQLRHKLVPLKYLPFVVEINAGIKVDKIGVIKGTDPYEILRIMQTNGDDYEISNQDIIDHLKEWERSAAFDIVGADNDWVEIEFRTLPKDLRSFAEDVYDFSPDSVDQGSGSVDELVKEIKRTNRLFLWWD